MNARARTARSYTPEQTLQVLEDMVKTVRTYSENRKGEFVEDHPWAMIFMGFFPISEIFLRLASHPDHKIEVVMNIPVEEIQRRIAEGSSVIKYRMWAPDDREDIIFTFVKSKDDEGFFYDEGE